MYIKKYLTLRGNISGTVKYEALDDSTRIHMRITSNIDDIFRVYLANKKEERVYAGIISEAGMLSFETKGIFDAVYITKKCGEDEKICADAFSEEVYILTFHSDESEKEKEEDEDKEALNEIDSEDALELSGGIDEEIKESSLILGAERANIKFHIASNEPQGQACLENSGVAAATIDLSDLKSRESEEESADAPKCAEKQGREESAPSNTDYEESASERALRALLLLLIYLEQKRESETKE